MRLFILATLLAAPAIASAEPLELVCQGTALHTETTQTYGSVRTDDGDGARGSATSYRRARSTETLRVRLDDAGGGKVKMPPSLIPTLSRGKDGWWDFIALTVTDDAIRGQFSMNVLNRPTVLVDRRTGDIDMKGLGMKFSGSCEKATEAPESRKF